ncbi:MAG: ABC transporter ATP-binding protein [Chloroflexota bacterium]
MFISSLLITGGTVAGGWGLTRYVASRLDSPVVEILAKPNEPMKSPPAMIRWQPPTPNLAQMLRPDRLVPPSSRLHRDLAYADRSPWKNQVVPREGDRQEDGAQQELGGTRDDRTLIHDVGLMGKYIRTYWSPYWAIGLVSGVGLMGSSIYHLFYAQALRVIVDIGTGRGTSLMLGTLMKLAIALPTTLGLALVGERLTARLTSRIGNDIRHDLFSHLQRLSQDFHKDAKLGDLIARFSVDMRSLESAMGEGLVTDVGSLLMVMVSFTVMLNFAPFLALLTLIPIIPLLYPASLAARSLSAKILRLNQQQALMMNAVQEGMRGQPMVAGFGLESHFAGYFGEELKKFEDAQTDGLFSMALFQQLSVGSVRLFLLWVLTTGTLSVISGAITVGTLVGFVALAENLYSNLSKLVNEGGIRWIHASVGLKRIEELLQHQGKIGDAKDAYPLSTFHHRLRFEDVSFSYDGLQTQLHGLNLTIEAGEFVAFVGPSGAGKSTIFQLLMRFYDPTEGRITIDDQDLRRVTQASLRAQMGVVMQETFLFNTSLLGNIRIVKPDASEEEVIVAAQAAELHEFVLSLPDGYQTTVGEAGGRLSGGQRQRVAIARALLYNPPILLLDEATSSLSADMAHAIMETILSLVGRHTIIMITHQLQAVVHADRIFVLEQGELVEQGTHSDLLGHNGLYRHHWETQNQ